MLYTVKPVLGNDIAFISVVVNLGRTIPSSLLNNTDPTLVPVSFITKSLPDAFISQLGTDPEPPK